MRGRAPELDTVDRTLTYLKTRLALSPEQLRKVVVASPQALGYSVETHIEPKLAYLETRLGLSQDQLRKVVVAFPTALSCSIEENLEPTLAFYGEALRLDTRGLAAFIYGFPTALGYSVSGRLRPRYDRCLRAGMEVEEVDRPVVNAIMVRTVEKFDEFLGAYVKRKQDG